MSFFLVFFLFFLVGVLFSRSSFFFLEKVGVLFSFFSLLFSPINLSTGKGGCPFFSFLFSFP